MLYVMDHVKWSSQLIVSLIVSFICVEIYMVQSRSQIDLILLYRDFQLFH